MSSECVQFLDDEEEKKSISSSMKWISEPSQTVFRTLVHLKPSRTVLQLFIDSEMLLLMMMTMDLQKLWTKRTSCCCHCWNRTGGRQED
uniref:Uncharacterized protein n=1 Tax=Oryza barthii TaxID=65489 RepID=A0A0D3GXL7_9ORYZ